HNQIHSTKHSSPFKSCDSQLHHSVCRPSSRVASDFNTSIAIESSAACTEPSQYKRFTTPGCGDSKGLFAPPSKYTTDNSYRRSFRRYRTVVRLYADASQ